MAVGRDPLSLVTIPFTLVTPTSFFNFFRFFSEFKRSEDRYETYFSFTVAL